MTDMMLENVAQRHVCIYLRMYVFMYVCIYLSTYVCIYVCMYVCICMYVYVHMCTCTTCITLLRYAADTQRHIYALYVPVVCVPQEHTQTICTQSLAVTHTSSPCFQNA